MVKYNDVLAANSTFFSTKPSSEFTAVFLGATSGIGLGTLRAFARHTAGSSPTLYVVGRSKETLDSIQQAIAKLNPTATFVPVTVHDLTLVKDAQAAAQDIALRVGKDSGKIDFLFMSPGYISYGRDESPEGLDRVTAIRFYSRMRFLLTLAPLLHKSSEPRVVNVLAGGKEGKLFPDDWLLKENYSIGNAGGAASSMTTLFLEELAKQPENAKIAFTHTFPGVVGNTGISIEGLPWWAATLMEWIGKPLVNLFGYTVEQAGERTLYGATSPQLQSRDGSKEGSAQGSNGARGSGVYLLTGDSSVVAGNSVLTDLRNQGLAEQLWSHALSHLSIYSN